MKKLVVTAAIVLGIAFGATAQMSYGGGLFQKGNSGNGNGNKNNDNGLILPYHGLNTSQDANENPLGGGALLLIGFGAAYMMGKRKHE